MTLREQYEKETDGYLGSLASWRYIEWLEDRANKLYDEKEYLWTTTIAANDKKIHELEDRLRWRDASKELPELEGEYLCLCNHDTGDYYDVCEYMSKANDLSFWFGNVECELVNVTHWLPIPKPEES